MVNRSVSATGTGSQPGEAGGPAPAPHGHGRVGAATGRPACPQLPQWDTIADAPILARLAQIRQSYELAHQAQYLSTATLHFTGGTRKLVYII